jgi:hypothetical protein
MKNLQILLLGVFLLLSMTACDKDEPTPITENKLQAHAGDAKQVVIGSAVELDGTASTDGNNLTFTYHWTFKSKPLASNANFVNASLAKPVFVADKLGAYEIELKISNQTGESKSQVIITAVQAVAANPGVIDKDITEDTILENIHEDPTLIDYIVKANVDVKAKLSIMPGVNIAFESNRRMVVRDNGALVAIGTAENKIIFAGKNSVSGDWHGLIFLNNSPLNELKYAEVNFAGGGVVYPLPHATAVGLGNNAALKMSNTAIKSSAGIGLYAGTNANFSYTVNQIDNSSGLQMLIPVKQAHKIDAASIFSGKEPDQNIVELHGGEFELQEAAPWQKLGNNAWYRIKENLVVKSGLNIAKGAKIGMATDVSIRIVNNGYLNATGSADELITFDILPAGNQKWGGIVISSNQVQNRLEHVMVLNAGNNKINYGLDKSAAVGIDNGGMGRLAMKNTTIKGSLAYGLLVEQGGFLFDFHDNIFIDNQGPIISLSLGLLDLVKDGLAHSNGNTKNSVEVLGSNLQKFDETVWEPLPHNVAYYFPNSINILSGLKLMPGTTLEFGNNAFMNIMQSGYLTAIGTANEGKIIIKGAVDQPGYWGGIIIRSAAIMNHLEHCTISGGGSAFVPNLQNIKANIAILAGSQGRLTLRNSKIEKGAGFGVAVESSFGASLNADAQESNQFTGLSGMAIKVL